MKKYNIAVVGATGMVGRMLLQVLTERKLPVENFYLFASERSAGTTIEFMGKTHTVILLSEENIAKYKPDIALLSAGGETSKKFAPVFAAHGCVVIDNSSAWRTDTEVPLVVPEVNAADIAWNKGIIANPNCSTIQAVVALKPLHDAFGIKRVIYSTYQAVSGAGQAGYKDLQDGAQGKPPQKFPHPIYANVIPHIDVFLENGYTKEEEKMVFETKKILGEPDLKVTATTVRVPVFHGHSESINIEFNKSFDMEKVFEVLRAAPGITVIDDVQNLKYPMPVQAENKDDVFVGRIRRDFSADNAINIWVVADNIRKGAATNTVQIAEALIASRN